MINKKKCIVCWGDMKYFCKWTDFISKTTKKIFKIYKCKECWLEMILPQPNVEEITTFYPHNYYSYIDKDINISERYIDKMLIKLLNRTYKWKNKIYDIFLKNLFFGIPFKHIGKNKFLDIGCGNWQKLRLMKEYWWDTYGFEIGEKKNKNNIFYDKNIAKVDFGKLKFDFINISHVLEHVPDPINFLKKIYSILSKDGVIYLNLPNTWGILSRLFKWPSFMRDTPRHLINYNYRNTKILLNKMWFDVIKRKTLLWRFLWTTLEFYFISKFNKDIKKLQKSIIYRWLIFSIEYICWILWVWDHMWFIIKKWYEKE